MQDEEGLTNDAEFDAELAYWLQQGLVVQDDNGDYRATEEGWKDPIVAAVFQAAYSDVTNSLIEMGLIEAFWDTEQGDLVFKLTEAGEELNRRQKSGD